MDEQHDPRQAVPVQPVGPEYASRQRGNRTPGWLIAAGILACVMGALNACGVLGGVMGIVMMKAMSAAPAGATGAAAPLPPGMPDMRAMYKAMDTPENRILQAVGIPVNLVVTVCVVAGAIGALRRRRWCFRPLVAGCVLAIAMIAVSLPFTLRAQKTTQAAMAKDPRMAPGVQIGKSFAWLGIGCSVGLGVGLPIAILALVGRRSAREYLKNLPAPAAPGG